MRLGEKACDQEEDWYSIVNYNIVPGPMVQRGSTCLGQENKRTLFHVQYIHMYCISSKLNRDIRLGGQAHDEVGNSSNAIMHGLEELMKLNPRWDLNLRLSVHSAGGEEGRRREEGGGRMCPGRGNLAQEPPSPEIIRNRQSERAWWRSREGRPRRENLAIRRRIPKSSKIDDLSESGGGFASSAPEKETWHRKSLI